ncbi:MAG: hypothetical protein R3D71_09140 [Rickettsiales bacterium]
MQNSAVKVSDSVEEVAGESVVSVEIVEQVVESEVVEFIAQAQIVAGLAEEACHLDENMNCPDFDSFEEKYGFGCFA